MKRAPVGLLPHLEWFAQHHIFATILVALALGMLADKLLAVLRRDVPAVTWKSLLNAHQLIHIGGAMAALAAAGHTWLTDVGDALDTLCGN